MTDSYSLKDYDKEHMAKVIGRALPVSTKQSIVICDFIRHKGVEKAKETLNKVAEKKVAVPFKRFQGDMGHKRKIGPGRFPVKTSQEIVKLLESVEANAQFKGLDTSSLVIKHICANRASKTWHYGRKRRRRMKRTNIEIVVEEQKKQDKKQGKKQEGKKEQTKPQEQKKQPKQQPEKKEKTGEKKK